jgi:flagellar biosynthetic protein FlhB
MADKTEAPTPRRLEDARSEGQVVRSIELNAAASMLIAAFLLSSPVRQLGLAMADLMREMLVDLPKTDITLASLQKMGFTYASRLIVPVGVILVALLVTGVVVTVAQTGFLWSTKKMGFDFKRINPLSGFKRIFSSKGLIELARALLKLTVIGWVAYSFIRSSTTALIMLSQQDLRTSSGIFVNLCVGLAVQVGEAYFVLAIADYIYHRWDLMRTLRMSKEEIKEEVKRSEGDPYLKARIRSQMRKMARGRMMSNVPKASVVVVNPTHLALAIEYKDGMHAPRLLAKGAHHTAERIVAIAREHQIPVVQNIPLARAIFKRIEVEEEIPSDLYLAMAEVLAYVYRLRGMTPSSEYSPV